VNPDDPLPVCAEASAEPHRSASFVSIRGEVRFVNEGMGGAQSSSARHFAFICFRLGAPAGPRVLCVGSYPTAGELRMIEPEFPFRQFFDFRFGVDASHFFNSPTLSKRCTTCAIRVSVAQLATPIERALFCRLSSQADFVEWPASAPSLSLTPQQGWIAAGRFALASPGRKSPSWSLCCW
jgi:hypothetical protein